METTFASIFIYLMQFLNINRMTKIGSSVYFSYIEISIYSLCILLILFKYIQLRQLSIYNVMLYIGIISIIILGISNSRSREFALIGLYWMALNKEDYRNVFTAFFRSNVLILTLNAFLSIFGLYEFFYVSSTGIRCLTLGFTNPNQLGSLLFSVVILYEILFQSSRSQQLVIEIFVGVICMFLIKCRTAGISLFSMAALSPMFERIRKKTSFKYIMLSIFPVLSIISIIIASVGNAGNHLSVLDAVLGGRFFTWNYYFKNMPITLFGNWFYTSRIFALDNAYLYLLFRYGVIIYIIYGVANSYLSIKCVRQNRTVLLVAYMAFSIYGLMEAMPITAQNNFLLVSVTTDWTYDKE